MNITIHLGKTPVRLSRKHARELFYELDDLRESGVLDKPRREIHTVPTKIEMIQRDVMLNTSAAIGRKIFRTPISRDPYLDWLAGKL